MMSATEERNETLDEVTVDRDCLAREYAAMRDQRDSLQHRLAAVEREKEQIYSHKNQLNEMVGDLAKQLSQTERERDYANALQRDFASKLETAERERDAMRAVVERYIEQVERVHEPPWDYSMKAQGELAERYAELRTAIGKEQANE